LWGKEFSVEDKKAGSNRVMQGLLVLFDLLSQIISIADSLI
jgi:hypothetical protein